MIYDFLAAAGVALIGLGLYLIYPPLAYLVTGACLLVLGLFAGRGEAQRQKAGRGRR